MKQKELRINGKVFDGIVTPEISALVYRKRMTLGVSIHKLESVLHVSSSTIKNWETGKFQLCKPNIRVRLAEFLNGKFDSELKHLRDRPEKIPAFFQRMAPELLTCMERAMAVYTLGASQPEIQTKLYEDWSNVLDDAIRVILRQEAKL